LGWLRKALNPSPTRFAQKMIRGLRASGLRGPVKYNPDGNRLLLDGDADRVMYLDNAYSEFCAAPLRRRRQVFQNYLRAFTQTPPTPPDDYAEAKPNILPRIRDRFYYEEIRLRFRVDGANLLEIPTRPIAGQLAVELVYDFPDSVGTITQAQLDKWGVTFDEAMAVARDNMWRISNQPFGQPAPGFHVSPWHDNHDASRLLLHDLVWQLKVNGDHVAIAPTRDVLLVTGSNDVVGLRRMLSMAEAAFQDTRANLAGAVRLRGSTWEPLDLPPEHPVYLGQKNFDAQIWAVAYERQKGLLEAQHAKSGQDVFVASVILTEEADTGRYLSMATWTKGVETLLPRVDRIFFVDMDEPESQRDVRSVAWDDAVRDFRSLMTPMGLYPERWRVREFPTPEQLRALPSII